LQQCWLLAEKSGMVASCTFRLPAFLLLVVVIGRAATHAQQLWNGGTCELCSGTALCSTWEGTIFPPAMAAKMPPMPQLGGSDATTTQRFVEYSIFPESTDVEAIRADPTILNGRKPLHIVRVEEDPINKKICTVLVNNKGCQSCSVCANGAYTVDCTNLSHGLALTCDTHTILFPLHGLATTGTTTTTTTMAVSKEEEEVVPMTGGSVVLPKVPVPTKAPTKAPAATPTKWPVRAPSKWPIKASAPSSKWPVRAVPPTKSPAVVQQPPSKWPVKAPTTAIKAPAIKAPASKAPVNAGPSPVTTTTSAPAAAVVVDAKAVAAASTEEEVDPISVPPSTSESAATASASAMVHAVVVLVLAVLLLPL
jgi:hypothetical protein